MHLLVGLALIGALMALSVRGEEEYSHGPFRCMVKEQPAEETTTATVITTTRAATAGDEEVLIPDIIASPRSRRQLLYTPASSALSKLPDLHARPATLQNGMLVQTCSAGSVCLNSWSVEYHPETNTTVEELQVATCWPGTDECQKSTCASHAARPNPKNTLKTAYVCCCSGDLCNMNYSISSPEPATLDSTTVTAANGTILVGPFVVSTPKPDEESYLSTYLTVGVLVGLTVLFAMAFCLVRGHYQRKQTKLLHVAPVDEPENLNLGKEFPGRIYPDRSPVEARDVLILEKLAFGRYGEVYKALVAEQIVAVKKFLPRNREFFLNECRVYNLPFMEHDSVLKFLAATEVRDESTNLVLEYWLVVEYHPNKTLSEYLKQRTVDARTLVDMALSLATGLAHLHLEEKHDGLVKPMIVHRDLNSRNILVRQDLRLCICDMGFAMALHNESSSPECSQASRASSATSEPSLLNDVGTVRYMAPEVLEGSLNLRDSATALRQVDMYAFGLILWEMSMRCADLYRGGPVAEYQLPFQKETGLKPSFSVMQVLVGKKKARPLCSDFWKPDCGIVRVLRETMEECWDADAEARLTSRCVVERLAELGSTIAPRVITNNLESTEEAVATATSLPTIAPTAPEDEEDGEDVPMESMGLLTTVDETMGRPPNVKNVNELYGLNSIAPPSRTVQPHQGRNPCLERNIKPESSEELTSSGNNLIGKKTGQRKNTSPPELSDGTRNRVLENAEHALLGNLIVGATGDKKARQKKVPNALAAEQNRSGFFGLFKKNSDSNNLLKYRAVPLPGTPAFGSTHLLGTLPRGLVDPTTIATSQTAAAANLKCNIQTAAKLLPQMLRRDVAAVHDGSSSTQLTCLSPSPSTSTSGHSPPTGRVVVVTSPRFSAVNSGADSSLSEDPASSSSSPHVLIDISSSSSQRL
ncbi:Bone morphogenetic protein receptor type-2 [Hypsibius exemplaris]|uniref:receptor protein serine/threonine kinase n=1 Tax=Hypsibius exemplaris TaxID=2072580 RepID=A0A1W0WQR3_HYPEX|nr:Bone morphogenetic protein receptor type-2 [Hypsibius exemplaris]